MSLILVQFPPGLKLSGPFIWAEPERGTLSGNRCSGCLMLACGGPAGLETWSNHDPILETHNAVAVPSHLLSDEAARCQKYTQLCWIKHLTHWLPDWWWDRRSYPGDGKVWDLPHLRTQLVTQVNRKVSVKLAAETRKRLNCYSSWGWELSCRMWYWIWLLLPGESDIYNTAMYTRWAGKCLVCLRAEMWHRRSWKHLNFPPIFSGFQFLDGPLEDNQTLVLKASR